ncbi:unnamed protein product [Urochloa decumbens]|uniref:Uncharacterized protein n=1 Tax=Urochloa decumbens TaxID=240449 RepID=A0ABC9F1E6_9POAL
MDIATGALNTLLPKLGELVVGEYKLQSGVNGEIKELEKELESMRAVLHNMAEMPAEQLDELAKIWANDVRELSYDIEDTVDTFMFRGKGHQHTKLFSFKGLIGKVTDLYNKAKTNHKIHNIIKDIMVQVKVISERRGRYNVDGVSARPNVVTVDPRLEAMYRKATELVGIHRPKNELTKWLFEQDCSSRQQPHIVSIVGFGGLGKTTLANALLQDHKAQFDCHIFVSVSLNPDIKKIFKRMLHQLDEKKYASINEQWDEVDLINKIRELIDARRCLCVIDDIWNESPWDTIKLALQDGSHGSKIIITTRNKAVAEYVGGGVYELKPLSNYDSKLLLNKRIFDAEDGCPPSLREVAEKILKKCGGVPLAIITTASLLASKPRHLQDWEKVNNSIGFGFEKNHDVEKMKNILCLSYNDLPVHLKTCLLYLSKYPEDMEIRKDVLVLGWLAEGFITHHGEASGKSLMEIGESYFNEFINRSLIQPVYNDSPFTVNNVDLDMLAETEVHACQVHDMVLELINQLSAEEGFATTVLSDGQQARTHTTTVRQRKIRRLSLHNSNKSYALQQEREQLFKVRSLDVFGHADLMPALSRFHVLRVLQVHDCSRLDNKHLKDLDKLYLLRFLRLQGLRVTKLPESIGKLEFLETLDIRGNDKSVIMLPVSFGKLGNLARLLATGVELSDGLTLENMKSLQVLVGICATNSHTLAQIGKLTKLKSLSLEIKEQLEWCTGNSNELIIMCLQMCSSLQELVIRTPTRKYYYLLDFMTQVSSGLQRFMSNGIFEEEFPRWIDSSLSCLTVLSIMLGEVQLSEHLEKLAELPSLRYLRLRFNVFNKHEKILIPYGASAFPCLTDLEFQCIRMVLKFQHGAMQKLQRLCLKVSVPLRSGPFQTSNNFDYGLENLLSLRHVTFHRSVRNNPEAQYSIRKAIADHPNHPVLSFV